MYQLIRSSGRDQHFAMRAKLKNTLGQRTPISRRQAMIDDEQIDLLIPKRLRELERLRSSGGVQDRIPLFCKRHPDHIAQTWFVVDDQNRRRFRLDIESG